jgi:hypothetical protein
MSREFYEAGVGNNNYWNSYLVTYLTSELVRPVFLLEANFDGTYERMCTHHADIVVDGVGTFYGGGDFLSFSAIDEPLDLRSSGINITLNGLDSSILDKALNTEYQDRTLKIFLGFRTPNAVNTPQGTKYLLNYDATPPVIFEGRMDSMSIVDNGATCTINVAVENRLVDFERSSESRYTYEEQQLRNSGDNSLEWVTTIQKRVLTWGA